ncbi:PAS domain-containing protein (plasmid) [Sinorhizobium fredii GR64]|nr:PAS domain-containing protein [Sinorhizobium fredii GR64]
MGGDNDIESAGSASQRFGLAGLAEAIIETLDQPLLILTADLTVADLNSSYCETFGVTAKETRGQPDLPAGQRAMGHSRASPAPRADPIGAHDGQRLPDRAQVSRHRPAGHDPERPKNSGR